MRELMATAKVTTVIDSVTPVLWEHITALVSHPMAITSPSRGTAMSEWQIAHLYQPSRQSITWCVERDFGRCPGRRGCDPGAALAAHYTKR